MALNAATTDKTITTKIKLKIFFDYFRKKIIKEI